MSIYRRRGHKSSREEFLKLSGAGLAGAALLGVAGCGGSNEEGESGSITVAAWNLAADALEAEVKESFSKQYSDINVTIQRVSDSYEQITPRLQTGSGAPDIVQIQQRDFQNFLARFPDQFADITDRIGSHDEEFANTAWASVVKNGKAYAVPWDLGPTAAWYRKDYFEQAGINPESLTTWDKFIEAGKQLQQKVSGVKMTGASVSSEDAYDTWQILMNQLSGEFYGGDNETNLTINLSNAANVKALEMLSRFKDEGIVRNGQTWDDRVRIVANGGAATVIYPVWYAGTIKTQAKDQKGKWGAFPLPAFTEGGNNQANLGGSILAITSQSQNKEAAWKFLEHTLLTNKGQDIQMDHGLFPAWQPYYDSEASTETDNYFGFSLVDFFGDLSTDIPTLQFGPYFLEIDPPLSDALVATLTAGKNPEEALRAASKDVASATKLEVES